MIETLPTNRLVVPNQRSEQCTLRRHDNRHTTDTHSTEIPESPDKLRLAWYDTADPLPVFCGMAIIRTTHATGRVPGGRKLLLIRPTSPMADYTKYDPRVDSLVMESLTDWDPAVGKLSDEDKVILAKLVHRSPEKAKKISYFRSHTGFTREITVTVDDIARIYDEQTVGR